MSVQTICYIDDCDSNLSLIKKAFSSEYNVSTFNEPTNVVDALNDLKPDLILLDVNLPGADGYDVCRDIRNTPALESIPIVFLTCRSGLQDRLTGFEAGGDAYVGKPFELAELNFIVRAQLNRYRNLRKVEDKAHSASNLAWTMMQNNSEIGQVVQYARALSNVRDETELLQATFASLGSFGLCSTLLARFSSGEIVARSDRKPFTPIEAELLELACYAERIVYVGNKYIFSGKNCVFLINNMPVHDEALTGRLRDHLAIMLESCDAAIELINYRKSASSRQLSIANQAQSTVTAEIFKLTSMIESLNQHAEQSFEKLTSTIEESFLFLGLTEEQESQLMKYIDAARADNDRYKQYGLELQDAMGRVAQSLEMLTHEYRDQRRH